MKLSSILKAVDQNYATKLKFILKFDDGFRNSVFKVFDKIKNKVLVLIIYKDEKGIETLIKNSHAIAFRLESENMPVRIPLISKDKSYYIKTSTNRFLGLYNFLEGETIPWESYKRRHLKAIGKTLSNFHFFSKDIKLKLPLWKDEITSEFKLMKQYFKRVTLWIEKKLHVQINFDNFVKTEEFLKNFIAKNEEKYVLHYDFVRGNILFSKKVLSDDTYEVTGLIDFEKVCRGPIVADIARTLSFLIVDCKFKTEEEIKKWFLLRGYGKRGKFKINIKLEVLESLLQIFWLRDFYKFLLHNPYESLKENEHYIRTKNFLINRNLLTKLK